MGVNDITVYLSELGLSYLLGCINVIKHSSTVKTNVVKYYFIFK